MIRRFAQLLCSNSFRRTASAMQGLHSWHSLTRSASSPPVGLEVSRRGRPSGGRGLSGATSLLYLVLPLGLPSLPRAVGGGSSPTARAPRPSTPAGDTTHRGHRKRRIVPPRSP